ncbi:hypothetical protein PGN35_004040 [Nodosilinea sp. PGN35]|uniref:hypothetical protein n=1 Tax=Nodosilinea sp. PGN35 TaxID=3020489 RepID=UPI0023B2BC39|nr:hypothetical protein [Nodosilinea sp. TSF1-S3]MDF0365790.1 hypothetical protein [Nodosilinea sp. TSF1-S3]
MPPNGKTQSLLSRFPDFYAVGADSALHALAAALGDALESAETDLVRVLRSHFVDTASNSSAPSSTLAPRGDLDRLFALYLERLGGTSQLVQVNNQFQPRDLLELETLVREIVRPQTALGYDLQNLGPTAPLSAAAPYFYPPSLLALLERYDVDLTHRQDRVHFAPATWTQPATTLTRLLIGRDPLLQYLKNHLSDSTHTALNRYTGADQVPPDLLAAFTADLNRLLPERALTQAIYQRYDYLRLGQTLQTAWLAARDRLAQDPALTFTADDLPQAIARYLRKKLPLPLQKQLFRQQLAGGFTAADLPNLVAQLQPDLSHSLPQAGIWQPLLAVSQNQAAVASAPDNLRLSLVVVTALLQAAAQAARLSMVSPEGQFPTLQAGILAQLAGYAPATPGDRIRHNRLCLEASYPAEIAPSGIPTATAVGETLAALLNQVILPDAELYSRNADFFSQLPFDAETQNLVQTSEAKPKRPLAALAQRRLNRLLLETAFPTALQKSYVPYRERLRDLIQVLLRGASTQQGILDIVAANLGIFADSEAALAARQAITIEEYQPVLEAAPRVTVMPSVRAAAAGPEAEDVWPNQFTLSNPNVEPTAITLYLELTDQRPASETTLAHISQLTLVNAASHRPCFTFDKGLKIGDKLLLLADGRLFHNGAYIAPQAALVLPVGESQWYITAQVGDWPGRLGEGQFDFSRFDQDANTVEPLTAEQASNYGFTLGYDLQKLTPGFFQVNVPWDIPGFTDRFDDNTDHPRRQIPGIINRVRAAGTHFAIAYTKTFRDRHDLHTQLTLIPAYRSPPELFDQMAAQHPADPPYLVEPHAMADSTLDITSEQTPYGPNGMQHTMGDRLLTSVEGRPLLAGVFDYTEFDSGNTFA